MVRKGPLGQRECKDRYWPPSKGLDVTKNDALGAMSMACNQRKVQRVSQTRILNALMANQRNGLALKGPQARGWVIGEDGGGANVVHSGLRFTGTLHWACDTDENRGRHATRIWKIKCNQS